MIAHASERPSNVAVPRPTSSRMISERSVALLRMFAVSCISTMNVDSPRASWSDAPTRVKMRSQMPSARLRRRHERAGLVEQHDQRDLAEVRRLAAHVRAGDDLDAVAVAVDVGVRSG